MTAPDDDVLRELRTALDVTPPPGFQSRVMGRVLQGADSSERVWIVPAVGAAMALVVMLLVLPSRTTPRPDRQIVADAANGATSSTLARATPAPTSIDSGRLRSSEREGIARAATRRRPIVSEVLVPDDQARRLQTLVEAVAAGRVVMAPPRPEPAPAIESLPLAPTRPVVIQAMAIKPLSEDISQTEWR